MSEDQLTKKCPIWGTPADTGDTRENHIYAYSPRAGGYYEIPYWLEHDLDHMDNLQKAKLTTILVDLRRQGDNRPYIYGKHIKEAKIKNNIYVYERANRLLEYFVLNSKNIGHNMIMHSAFDPSNEYHDWESYSIFLESLAWSESIKKEEIRSLIDYLANQKFLQSHSIGISPSYRMDCRVLVEGYRQVEENITKPDASQVFVAMWFGEEMDKVYEHGIKKALENAGYKSMRIDNKEDVNKIDDAIIAEIRRSRFLIADFTHGEDGARGGVYYEAGFATGLVFRLFIRVEKTWWINCILTRGNIIMSYGKILMNCVMALKNVSLP